MKSRERCDATAGLEVCMSKTWRWFVVVAALLVTSGLAGAAWLQWSRPTVLRVAVGPSGFADAELMAAFSRTLNSNKCQCRTRGGAHSRPERGRRKADQRRDAARRDARRWTDIGQHQSRRDPTYGP